MKTFFHQLVRVDWRLFLVVEHQHGVKKGRNVSVVYEIKCLDEGVDVYFVPQRSLI